MIAGKDIKINIRPLLAESAELIVNELETVGELRNTLAKLLSARQEELVLIHFGEVLADNSMRILQYRIVEGDTVFVSRERVVLKVFSLMSKVRRYQQLDNLQRDVTSYRKLLL